MKKEAKNKLSNSQKDKAFEQMTLKKLENSSVFVQYPQVLNNRSVNKLIDMFIYDMKMDDYFKPRLNKTYCDTFREFILMTFRFFYGMVYLEYDAINCGRLLGLCKFVIEDTSHNPLWDSVVSTRYCTDGSTLNYFNNEKVVDQIKEDIVFYGKTRCDTASSYLAILKKCDLKSDAIIYAGTNISAYNNCLSFAAKVVAGSLERNDKGLDMFCEESDVSSQKKLSEMFTTLSLYNKMKAMVFGQDDALKHISVMANVQMKRIDYPEKSIDKINYMLMGPTGNGKTEITRALAEIMPVPVITLNCSQCVPEGYIGVSLPNMLSYYAAKYSANKYLPYSIIVLDEADKLINKSHDKDRYYGMQIQADLLKIVEGGEIHAKDGKDYKHTAVNTTNMCFLFTGSFDYALQETLIAQDKFDIRNSSKFNNLDNNLIREALVQFGMMPELLGRIGNFTMLNLLKPADFVDIFINKKDSLLSKYTELFGVDGVDFQITKDALTECAKIAYKRKEGVRGMASIINNMLTESMFDASAGLINKASLDKKLVASCLSN